MNYTKTRAPCRWPLGNAQARPAGPRRSQGVYHINLVDEVTPWQMVACVPAITQSHLRPVLQDLLERFPFRFRGFHSDNGSEFINDTVSGLLRDFLIVQTRSRARKSNNGLMESKNGAVIRKHIGYLPNAFGRNAVAKNVDSGGRGLRAGLESAMVARFSGKQVRSADYD